MYVVDLVRDTVDTSVEGLELSILRPVPSSGTTRSSRLTYLVTYKQTGSVALLAKKNKTIP